MREKEEKRENRKLFAPKFITSEKISVQSLTEAYIMLRTREITKKSMNYQQCIEGSLGKSHKKAGQGGSNWTQVVKFRNL